MHIKPLQSPTRGKISNKCFVAFIKQQQQMTKDTSDTNKVFSAGYIDALVGGNKIEPLNH